ncbi:MULTISPECIES: hypothetical protein [unclassified Lentimonas]|uniref:hypothetical protein n=1 Tax=unclassified Lentimonas TaxID=2630993 RepID=UPI001321478D|nr:MULTISPECIES: hypothetical protein [unclassified Lentimonas]CAA6676280.1 Unannotated [Lentimonas sp. CC4]CAA6683830.1 Unannotated [Lentimonas sp. CC6]CAA7077771.1 Unannotated [Lentimonas sp. CC4]CAA7169705.1 Unannotated [Lentimonas sp. CC21]CAA7179526.1 Unannotated [Lentimonas sp. CC8]
MTKTLTIAGILCIAALTSLSAAQKGMTKDQFVAAQKKAAAKKGWKFNQEKVEAQFVIIDTNKDGIVTGTEKKAHWAAKTKKDQK